MVWEIKMSDSEKIKELEKKVLELEKLKEQCGLTNEIKISLIKYIESNEKFKEALKKKVDENISINKSKFFLIIELIKDVKWVILIIVLVFMLSDKVLK
jgi:hypothetical protein